MTAAHGSAPAGKVNSRGAEEIPTNGLQHTVRPLPIATAPRKDSKRWKQEEISWGEVLEWLDDPADHKECGNYLLGTLRGTRRTKDTIVSRCALQLDADKATTELGQTVGDLGVAAAVHPTYNSAPEALRYRVVLPLSREVSPAEYAQLANLLMDHLGVEQFDPGSWQPERYMFRPATQDRAHYDEHLRVFDGPWLNPDDWLSLAPAQPAELHPATATPADQVPGVVGAVARTYSFGALVEEYDLPYSPAENGRWSYADHQPAGVNDLGNGRVFSHHAEDPIHGHGAVSGFDVVRLHRFGHLDKDAPAGTPLQQLPSHAAAVELFQLDAKVAAELDAPAAAGAAAGGGRGPLAVQLREHVEATHDIFPAADDGRVFAQPKAGGRAEQVNSGFVIRAAKALGRRSGSLSAAATEAAKVLTADAAASAPRRLALRVHHHGDTIVLDLAQTGSGRCVVVTPEGWSVQETPPSGVVFLQPGLPLPTPQHGGTLDDLRRLLRWSPTDPRWPLVQGWLSAVLLASVPRPMLGIFGPQGSAKTTTGRFVIGVLDPKPDGVLGSGFGKNRSDDETKALKSFLPAWDNVTNISEDGANFLSRLVTGESVEKRQLYSDDELVRITYRRSGIITGLTVPRGIKPDTLDRLVLIAVQPLEGERLSEGTLQAEWQEIHPRVLGAVLDQTAHMLGRLPQAAGQNTAGLRMADYAEALWAVDPALYAAYAENVSGARAEMAEDDPFIQTLLAWLRAAGGKWEGTADDARKAAEQHQVDPAEQWWPTSARSFSDQVTNVSELLRAVGITVAFRRSNGKKLKVFTLKNGAGA